MFIEAVGGEFFKELISTEKHKLYQKNQILSSNVLHILSESQHQCLDETVLNKICQNLKTLAPNAQVKIQNNFINFTAPNALVTQKPIPK